MDIPDMENTPLDVSKFTKEQFAIKIAEYVIVLGDNLTPEIQQNLVMGRILTPADVRQRKVKKEAFRTQFEELRTMVRTHTAGARNGGQGPDPLRGGTKSGVEGGLIGAAAQRALDEAAGKASNPPVELSVEERESLVSQCEGCWRRLEEYAPRYLAQAYPNLAEKVTRRTFMSMPDEALSWIAANLAVDQERLAPRPTKWQQERILQKLARLQKHAGLSNEQRTFVDQIASLDQPQAQRKAIRRKLRSYIEALLNVVEPDRSALNPNALAAIMAASRSHSQPQRKSDMTEDQRHDQDAVQEEQRDPADAATDEGTPIDEVLQLRAANRDLEGRIGILEERITKMEPLYLNAEQVCTDYNLKSPKDFYGVVADMFAANNRRCEQLREQGIDPDGNVGEQVKQLKDDKAAADSQLKAAQEHLAQQTAVPDSLVQLSTKLGTKPDDLASTIEAALTAAKQKLEEVDGQLQQTKAALRLADNGKAEAERKLGEKEKELKAAKAAADHTPLQTSANRLDWWNRLLWKGVMALLLSTLLFGYLWWNGVGIEVPPPSPPAAEEEMEFDFNFDFSDQSNQ